MGDLENLKEKILSFTLESSETGSLNDARILLQVCGQTGHGKSSFINSMKYALHGGRFDNTAPEASATESQGGYTRRRTTYPLTDLIVLVDNRGFGKSDIYEKEEIYAQLGNLQPLDEEVVWQKSFDERMEALTKTKPNSNDVLLPIVIHSAQCVIGNELKDEMKEFLENIKKLTGFLPFIILTKQYQGDVGTLRQQFGDLGMERIFAVENYTYLDHIKTPEKDKTFLTILGEALDLVNFKIHNAASFGTAEEEHLSRVQIMLKIAHKNEMETEIERRKAEWEKKHVTKPPRKFCNHQ